MTHGTQLGASTLGTRIVSAREAMELTTAQLARRLGIKTATLSGWETDSSEPRANRLVMLAAMANVSVAWLLTGKGSGPLEHTAENELVHIRANLVSLQSQSESIAGQIKELVQRIDQISAQQTENKDQSWH